MIIPRFVKGVVLAGCAAGFIATGLMGLWPTLLNTTRAPLYAGEEVLGVSSRRFAISCSNSSAQGSDDPSGEV